MKEKTKKFNSLEDLANKLKDMENNPNKQPEKFPKQSVPRPQIIQKTSSQLWDTLIGNLDLSQDKMSDNSKSFFDELKNTKQIDIFLGKNDVMISTGQAAIPARHFLRLINKKFYDRNNQDHIFSQLLDFCKNYEIKFASKFFISKLLDKHIDLKNINDGFFEKNFNFFQNLEEQKTLTLFASNKTNPNKYFVGVRGDGLTYNSLPLEMFFSFLNVPKEEDIYLFCQKRKITLLYDKSVIKNSNQ